MNEQKDKEYAAGREERMKDMAATTSKIVSVDRVHLFEGHEGSERSIIYNKGKECQRQAQLAYQQRQHTPEQGMER